MKIRFTSVLLGFLATCVLIGLMMMAGTCEASESSPQLTIKLDPEHFPPRVLTLSAGDSLQVEIEDFALVWLDKKSREDYYYEIIKNGRLIAVMMPQDKRATLKYGNYMFKVKSLSDDCLVATMYIHTQTPNPTAGFLGGLIILSTIFILGLSYYAFVRIRERIRENRFRRDHPAKIVSVEWHN